MDFSLKQITVGQIWMWFNSTTEELFLITKSDKEDQISGILLCTSSSLPCKLVGREMFLFISGRSGWMLLS